MYANLHHTQQGNWLPLGLWLTAMAAVRGRTWQLRVLSEVQESWTRQKEVACHHEAILGTMGLFSFTLCDLCRNCTL
jgi:hypothetical protein